jgi:hypothetical protein
MAFPSRPTSGALSHHFQLHVGQVRHLPAVVEQLLSTTFVSAS